MIYQKVHTNIVAPLSQSMLYPEDLPLIQFVLWEQTSVNAFSYYYYFFFLKSLAQIFQIPLLQFTLKFLKQDLTKGETNTVAPLIRSMLHPEVFPVSHLGCFESEQV